MKIEVTEEDIKNGKRFSPGECPIALAIQRATGKRATVGTIYATTWEGDVPKIYNLPQTAIVFIRNFDSKTRVVSPFEFELEENTYA